MSTYQKLSEPYVTAAMLTKQGGIQVSTVTVATRQLDEHKIEVAIIPNESGIFRYTNPEGMKALSQFLSDNQFSPTHYNGFSYVKTVNNQTEADKNIKDFLSNLPKATM